MWCGPMPASDIQVAAEAARVAGAILRERFQRPAVGVREKGDPRELVSEADLAADKAIREILERHRPGDAILTEEAPPSDAPFERRWVVDPLDGTTNYLSGIPYWCVSIALETLGGSSVGVIYDPLRDEMFQADRSGPTLLNGAPAAVREAVLRDAVLCFHVSPAGLGEQALRDVMRSARGFRMTGATALDLAWVAAGRVDGCVFRLSSSVWDWAAGVVLVEQAGGIVAAADELVPGFSVAASRRLAESL